MRSPKGKHFKMMKNKQYDGGRLHCLCNEVDTDTLYFSVYDFLTHIRPRLKATWSTPAALSLKTSSRRMRAPGNASSIMRMRTQVRQKKRSRSSPSLWPRPPALGQDNSAEDETMVKVRCKGVSLSRVSQMLNLVFLAPVSWCTSFNLLPNSNNLHY